MLPVELKGDSSLQKQDSISYLKIKCSLDSSSWMYPLNIFHPMVYRQQEFCTSPSKDLM